MDGCGCCVLEGGVERSALLAADDYVVAVDGLVGLDEDLALVKKDN